MSFKIVPIAPDFLNQARRQKMDALGQPVAELYSATGREPCRDVLRRAKPGEKLFLLSYSPFSQVGPYHEYGPIYILAEESAEPVALDHLPLAEMSSSDYFGEQLVLRAYNRQEWMLEAALVTAVAAVATVERLLENPDVAFLQARFPAAGCFACRIERA